SSGRNRPYLPGPRLDCGALDRGRLHIRWSCPTRFHLERPAERLTKRSKVQRSEKSKFQKDCAQLPHFDRSFWHWNVLAPRDGRLLHEGGDERRGGESRFKFAVFVQELLTPANVTGQHFVK